MFPLSMKGEISAGANRNLAVEDIAREIAEFLRAEGLTEVARASGAVRFRNTTVFMWSFQLFVMVGSGMFLVGLNGSKATLRYELSVIRLLIFSLVAVLFLGAALSSATNLARPEKPLILAAFWLWLFGGNYVLIRARTRSFLRRLLGKHVG